MRILTSPVLWLVLAIVAFNVYTWQSQANAQVSILQWQASFEASPDWRSAPRDSGYTAALHGWLDQGLWPYLQGQPRYLLQVVPTHFEPYTLLTGWLVFPSLESLALFAVFWLVGGFLLELRVGRLWNLALFIVASIAGLAIGKEIWSYLPAHLPAAALAFVPAGFFTWGFPLAGAGAGLALTLGICAGARRGFIILLALAWLVADFFVNGWAGSGPSVALALTSVGFVVLGLLIGLLFKRPRANQVALPQEAAPVSSKQWFGERMASQRAPVLSVEAVLAQANPDLDQAEEAVLHAPKDTSERQWLDWGSRFANLHLHRISVDCLENALAGNLPERLRTCAQLLVGAERKGYGIDAGRGKEQLQELLSLTSPDLAPYIRRAKRILAE